VNAVSAVNIPTRDAIENNHMHSEDVRYTDSKSINNLDDDNKNNIKEDKNKEIGKTPNDENQMALSNEHT
jgi:hypothetical protein